MTRDKYILTDNGIPVVEPDLMKWAVWFQDTERRLVARNLIGPSAISTVFLGLDHNFDEGPPVLWETMVFGGAMDQVQDRCSGSREQAEAMHAAMLERVRSSQ